MKKTAKKTSTTAEATLEAGPRPNQITKSDASTMRGMALSTLMYGPEDVGEEADPAQRDAEHAHRPSHPMTQPSSAS